MAFSSLIASIHSAFIRMEDATGPFVSSKTQDVDELKIGLRSLKALLLVSRVMAYTGGHGCLNALPQFLMQSSSSTFADLLPRIETVLDLLIHAEEIDAHSMAEKVHLLGEELDGELSWSCTSGICQSSSLLTADEVVGIIDSSLENAPGFLSLRTGIKFKKQTDAFEVIHAFEVHVRFMRSVLAFAGQVGVELENVLMPHIQPIVISAARVFIVSDVRMGRYEQRCSEIGLRCLRVNRMATDPQVYQAYSRALCIAKLSSTFLNMGDQVLKNLLESLISLLWDALRHASNSAVKDEIKLLYERMRFLRAVLKHQATSLDEAISDQVLALLCDAGVLICSFLQPDLGRLSDLLQRFDVFRAQVVASPTMMSQANDEFDRSFIIQIFQLLKVLHMDEIYLINGIPNEIGLLTQLRYLSFLTDIPILPSSVGNLTNLETFIPKISSHDIIAFPHTLWNLQNLKYLHICDGFTLPIENLEDSSSLLELETLSGVIFYGSLEKQLQKFPHIRRLKCIIRLIQESTEEELYNIVVPDLPTKLYSLTMRVEDKFVRCQFGSTAENLIKLKLDGFELTREEIAAIGKFPNLEVLKLSDIHFPDHTLEMEEEEFLKLRILKLTYCSSLERWTTSDDELPCLQKLGFSFCENLKEIPSWLEASSIEEIQVTVCSSALKSLVRRFVEVQEEFGNSIHILYNRVRPRREYAQGDTKHDDPLTLGISVFFSPN